MLKKTLAKVDAIKPGTYVPPTTLCYDPAEITELGTALNRLVYAPSQIRSVLQQKHNVTITRADYYSEIPTIVELEASFARESLLKLDAVFPSNDVMVAHLQKLMPASEEFAPPMNPTGVTQFSWLGGPFTYSDAMSYYTMIRTRKPNTIVEIGSGWSTLIAQAALKANGCGKVICIEPYPEDFLQRMDNIQLIKKRCQDVETAFFKDALRDGDFLFVDSTHTVKHDSDCLHIYLRILPAITTRVTVHAHDIYLPNPFPLINMRDIQIFWNEQYLLYATMLSNPRMSTIYGSQYHMKHNPELLKQFMHGRYEHGGASFWFEQAAAV